MSFRGLHSVNLDAKGRMAIPARFRGLIESQCEGHLVITIGADQQCLALYPANEFDVLQRKVMSLSSFDPNTAKLKRMFVGHAHDVELDASGRILIPPGLRGFVNLEKKVELVGQGDKLEIWDAESWEGSRAEWLGDAKLGIELSEALQGLSL